MTARPRRLRVKAESDARGLAYRPGTFEHGSFAGSGRNSPWLRVTVRPEA